MFISKKELAVRDERLRRAQEEIESLKQTVRELQSEVADDRICAFMRVRTYLTRNFATLGPL